MNRHFTRMFPIVFTAVATASIAQVPRPQIKNPPNFIVPPVIVAPTQTLTVVYTGTAMSGVMMTTNPKANFVCTGANPSAAVPKVQKSCTVSFPTGSYIDLYAKRITGIGSATITPIAGGAWSGDCKGQGQICSIKMDKARVVGVVDIQ